MEINKITRGVCFIALALIFSSCTDELDFSGFFYSDVSVNDRFDESIEWNNVHDTLVVNVDSESYHFLVAGDSHIGGTDNLDKFFTDATLSDASFTFIVGDLTSGHKEDYQVFDEHLSNISTLPAFFIAGNHDLFFDGWEYYYNYYGSSTYTFVVSTPSVNDLYICLDSGSGTLGDKQLNWLKDILKNTRHQYRNCIVFSHTNLFRAHRTTSTNMLIGELEVLLDLFARYNVDMMIMGHDHAHSEEWFGNTCYLTLDALEDEYNDPSYVEITNSEGVISHQFHSVN